MNHARRQGKLVWVVAVSVLVLCGAIACAHAEDGAQDVTKCIADLQNNDEQVRKRAVEALKEMGPAAKDAVWPLLAAKYEERNQDNWIRHDCSKAIEAIGKPAVPALATALRDKNNIHRYDAAQMLWHMSEKHGGDTILEALPALIEAVDDGSTVAGFSIRALRSLGPSAVPAVPALEKSFKGSVSPHSKQEVAQTLLTITGGKHKDAGKYLQQFRKDQKLVEAAFENKLAEARALLADGADVNARYVDFHAFLSAGLSGYTPLMAAAVSGHKDMLLLLLEQKPDVDAQRRGRTALAMAVNKERHDLAEALKQAGAEGDVEQMRLTAAMIAAACKGFVLEKGQPFPQYPGAPRNLEKAADIKAVVAQGGKVNCIDEQGFTPLMYAANLGLLENVKTLVTLGADHHIRSTGGDTALSMAERSGHGEVVTYLKSLPNR